MKERQPENTRLLLLSAGNFILLYAIYFVMNALHVTVGGQALIPWIYLGVGIGVFTAFFFLNRGFSTKPTMPDELPDSWNSVQKADYLRAERKRRLIARYLLTVLIPLIFVFLLDAVDLFLLNGVISTIGERLFH